MVSLHLPRKLKPPFSFHGSYQSGYFHEWNRVVLLLSAYVIPHFSSEPYKSGFDQFVPYTGTGIRRSVSNQYCHSPSRFVSFAKTSSMPLPFDFSIVTRTSFRRGDVESRLSFSQLFISPVPIRSFFSEQN